MKRFAMIFCAVMLLAGTALADCQKKVALNATALGVSLDASGTAEARAQGTRERFKISIDARVPDGTTYNVFVNGNLAGTITIQLGAGELQLQNDNGAVLPAGVSPVCAITSVSVTDGAGQAILTGSF